MEEAKKVAETVQLLRDLVKERHGEEAYIRKIEIEYEYGENKGCFDVDTANVVYEFQSVQY